MKSSNYYNLNKIILYILLIQSTIISAQNIDLKKSPKQALILSTAIPGLGQFYNKKYWKIPIIYSSIGGCVYLYHRQNKKYKEYKDAYIARNNDDNNSIDNFPQYSNSNLITLQDYHQNNRDLFGLLCIVSYVLNILDAHIDAHLLNYNINDNLTMHIEPQINNLNYETINLSLNIKF
tara:strand:+ start:5 stop:538 length:534 start_codon:yes stop_codon:yes gene_type:complete